MERNKVGDMIDYKQILNRVAEHHSYEAGFNGRLAKYRAIKILESIRQSKVSGNVLEVGCGEGSITKYLIDQFEKVVALEPARRFFEEVSSNLAGTPAQFENCMLEEFIPSESFDCVVAAGVLEHVADPSLFLRKVSECMHDDACFVLTVPNATSLHRRLGKEMGLIQHLNELGPLDRKVGHYRYYDFASLRSELEGNGFEVLRMEGIMLKPLPNDRMEELSEEYCDALFELGNELPEYCAEIFAIVKKIYHSTFLCDKNNLANH